jgi:hypothetical protein
MLKPALLSLALVASPAFASSHYHAAPVVKPAAAKIALRDTVWKCGDGGCAAAASSSRPNVVCAVLVKKVGSLSSFSVSGQALSAEELEKCNSRAK